jgi:hypothetical protein
MELPQNHIWGPSLWLILHSVAEKIGTNKITRLPYEEARIWSNLLSSLRYSLPCPMCKKHYTIYYNSNPIKSLHSIKSLQTIKPVKSLQSNKSLQTPQSINITDIREWLYNLHNNVNKQNNITTEITLEQLSEIYNKPFDFSANFKIFSEHTLRAIRIGSCLRDDVKKTIRALIELKHFYGII